MLTLREMEALQGFPSGHLAIPPGRPRITERQCAGMLGNAFTVAVTGRVALALLKTTGLVDDTVADVWSLSCGGSAPSF